MTMTNVHSQPLCS